MSTADTLSPSVTQYTGTPGPDATHWGIWKIDPRGKEERLRTMGPAGVSSELWPLSELTLEEVRNRWGGGEFQCFWMVEDPENPQPEARRRSAGRGRKFTVAPDARATFGFPGMPAPPPAGGGSFGEMERAVTLMSMIAQMSTAMRAPPITPDERNVDLAKEVAELRATLEADRKLREVEERHSKEVRRLEDDLREERARRRRAEEERDATPGVRLDDGEGLWDLVKKHAAANPGAALKQLREMLSAAPMLIGVVQEAVKSAQAAQAPPPPPAVAPPAIARPRAVPSHLRAVPDGAGPPAAAPPPAPPPSPPTNVPTVQTFDLGKLAAEEGAPRVPQVPQ